MSITRKKKQKSNLDQYRVWINDTDSNSRYFQITQLSDVLTAGKNAFLINGSPELVNGTEVLIELLDVNGNVIFTQPVRNYSEGLARLVSIEVYNDTPRGLGTLTILGHLARDSQGNLPPDEFRDSYNVKWQKKLTISPNLPNKNQVRLNQYPTASVSEVLTPFRIVSQSIMLVTGSGTNELRGKSLYDSENISVQGSPNVYMVATKDPFFTREMVNGALTVGYNDTRYSASVVEVINNSMVKIEPAFMSGDSYLLFTSTDFSMSYSSSLEYLSTENTRSYADLTVRKLNTFSGDVYRAKVFVTSKESPGEAEFLADFRVQSPELMVTKSVSTNEEKFRTGYFIDNDMVNAYWTFGVFDTGSAPFISSSYNPSLDIITDPPVIVQPFSPSDLGDGLIGWYSADTMEGVSDGDIFFAWSGLENSLDFIFDDFGAQYYRENVINGLPGLEMQGSITYGMSPYVLAQPNTLYMVVQFSQVLGTVSLIGGISYLSNELRVYAGNLVNTGLFVFDDPVVAVISVQFDGSNSFARMNREQSGLFDPGSNMTTLDIIPANNFTICELINHAGNFDDRVEEYLFDKYNI